MALDEIFEQIGSNPKVRTFGLFADYVPETTHKDVLYVATDQNKLYLNGKEIGAIPKTYSDFLDNVFHITNNLDPRSIKGDWITVGQLIEDNFNGILTIKHSWTSGTPDGIILALNIYASVNSTLTQLKVNSLDGVSDLSFSEVRLIKNTATEKFFIQVKFNRNSATKLSVQRLGMGIKCIEAFVQNDIEGYEVIASETITSISQNQGLEIPTIEMKFSDFSNAIKENSIFQNYTHTNDDDLPTFKQLQALEGRDWPIIRIKSLTPETFDTGSDGILVFNFKDGRGYTFLNPKNKTINNYAPTLYQFTTEYFSEFGTSYYEVWFTRLPYIENNFISMPILPVELEEMVDDQLTFNVDISNAHDFKIDKWEYFPLMIQGFESTDRGGNPTIEFLDISPGILLDTFIRKNTESTYTSSTFYLSLKINGVQSIYKANLVIYIFPRTPANNKVTLVATLASGQGYLHSDDTHYMGLKTKFGQLEIRMHEEGTYMVRVNNLEKEFRGKVIKVPIHPNTEYINTFRIYDISQQVSVSRNDLVKYIGFPILNSLKRFPLLTPFTKLQGIDISFIEGTNLNSLSEAFNIPYSDLSISLIKGLECLNTSNIESFTNTFARCKDFKTELNLSLWDTSKAVSMQGMFLDSGHLLSNIKGLELWDTSNVENMEFMFEGCFLLNKMNLFNTWNFSKVTNMSGMCKNGLVSNLELNLVFTPTSENNTKSLTHISNFSSYFSSLRTATLAIDLTNLVSAVEMFSNCESLTKVDMLGCTLPSNLSVVSWSNFFDHSDNLNEVKLPKALYEYIRDNFMGAGNFGLHSRDRFNNITWITEDGVMEDEL